MSATVARTNQGKMRSSNKKSILKRPIPAQLPLSPTWHSATDSSFPFRGINALLSPSNVPVEPTSPHVHFPPTPSMTTSHINVYSPGTYDRGSIQVSENELALPERGTRVYNNKRRTIPTNIPSDVQDENRNTTVKPTRASKVFQSRPASAVRFEPLALHSPVAATTSPSSAGFPVSPYPYTASPLSASFFPAADKTTMPFSPREFVNARNKENGSRCCPPSRVARKRGRRPAALKVPAVVMNPFRVFTPVVNVDIGLSPVLESSPTSAAASDTDNRLSSAFWKSVSLVDLNEEEDEVEGCMYPLSAVSMQDELAKDIKGTSNMMMKRNLDLNLDLDLSSPVDEDMESPAPVLFGRADGTLWSPGLPSRMPVSAASTEMTMYTASAGYNASPAFFSPMPTPSNNAVHSFSAHRASFGQRMGAVSRMGFNSPGFNFNGSLSLNDTQETGLNSPAPFRGNPMMSPLADAFVSVTSPGFMQSPSFASLQSPFAGLQSPSTRMFGALAQHHGLGFTSPSPMGESFPSFAVAATKIDQFEIPALGFPAKVLMGADVEGRSRVINAV